MLGNSIYRRDFLEKLGTVSLGAFVGAGLPQRTINAQEQQKRQDHGHEVGQAAPELVIAGGLGRRGARA